MSKLINLNTEYDFILECTDKIYDFITVGNFYEAEVYDVIYTRIIGDDGLYHILKTIDGFKI